MFRSHSLRIAAAALTLGLLSLPAHAQDRGARADDAAFAGDDDDAYVPPPKNRLWYSNASFLRVNPLGLINVHRLGWRHRLSTKDSILFQDTYVFVGGGAIVTPAWARIGGYAEVQPLAILRAFTEISAVGYYGTFDQILTWDDQDAAFDDASIAERGDAGEASGKLGYTMTFGGTLRAKVGPIAVRTTAQVSSINLDLDADNLYFYDQYWDRLAPDGGWMVLNDFDILFVKDKLRLGARHTFSDTLDGNGGDTTGAMAQHRVGPLFAWQFKDKKPGTKFNQPTVFVIAQWWLQHPYRTGEKQPQALPLIAAGFAFNGDYKVGGVVTPQP